MLHWAPDTRVCSQRAQCFPTLRPVARPPSAHPEPVSGVGAWGLRVAPQSPVWCSRTTRFQRLLLPVLLAWGPQGGAAPQLCSRRLQALGGPVTLHGHCHPTPCPGRKRRLPSGSHRAQPPGSLSPVRRGLSLLIRCAVLLRVVPESSGDLSASSKLSVTGSEVCFLVTDIIVLNFLRGCYQSVTDTLGNGAF